MGVITITISKGKPGSARTRDKASSLATMYAGLYDRLHKALVAVTQTTHDDYDPEKHPHAPAGSSKGGQFTATPGGGPTGPKPTSVVAKLTKAALHELLSTGHAFSKKELLDIMGPEHKEVTVSTWLSKFKSQKHAGEYGALDIKKLPNGSYQVVMPDGTPAPPAPADFNLEPTDETPLKDLLVKPPKAKEPAAPAFASGVTVPFQPVSKEKADISYAFHTDVANEALAENADGANPKAAEQAVLQWKQAKLTAQAQWKTNTTGVLQEPKLEDKIYEADKILAAHVAKGLDSLEFEQAIAQWKKNTQLEKQGQLGAKPAPKPETKELAKALTHWTDAVKNEPAPPPKPYEHLIPKGFKHISAEDFTKTGKDSFGYQITRLKKDLEDRGKGNAVGNKKMAESSLQEHLKDKKHFQALRDLYVKANGGFSLNSLESRLIGTWASSSGDTNPLSCALQIAAQDAFSLPKDAVTHEQLHSVQHSKTDDALMHAATSALGLTTKTAEEAKAVRQGFQEFVHAQYDNTQKMFKDMGIEHVMVARGMTKVPGDEHFTDKATNVKLQPASSFSANYGTASQFAGTDGTVYLCKVPVSQVLGTYLTGFGCTGEHEVVVLGHDTIKSFPVKKAWSPGGGGSTLPGALSEIQKRIEQSKGK